ncbi:MAG: tRNA (N6-isopentenyl adenosine(37)-C2)-methylthiotransferase MiaB [Spirochaetota bacterium]
MYYHLVPFGCQMNISDSERIRAVLESLGYERTDDEERADILGIVACSVRQKAIDKVYTRIHKWNEWKADRPLLTFVSGCVLPADREKFVDRFDLMFTINELPKLPDMLRDHGVVSAASLRAADQIAGRAPQAEFVAPEGSDDPRRGYWKIPANYGSGFEAFVPIQNGCDKFCTFCAVPYTRGREVSRPSEEILAEVRRLVENGYRSVTLLGQNVNSYGLERRSGRDGGEIAFPELLRRIGEIGTETGRRFWTYFTSPHPKDMTDEVIDVIASYPVLARQIHLPLQSGDDKVLIRMNRNYRLSEYSSIVEKIRSTIPEATLFTDIIVGFPGETDEQFEATRAAMREFAYNMAYIAMYSPRPGAASARWDDDVPHEEKRRRLHELSGELQAASARYNAALAGSEVSLLVDGRDRKEGFLTGKTEGKLIVRFASDDESLIGRFVTVRIDRAAPLSLEGSLVGAESDSIAGAAEATRRSRDACRAALATMTAAETQASASTS